MNTDKSALNLKVSETFLFFVILFTIFLSTIYPGEIFPFSLILCRLLIVIGFFIWLFVCRFYGVDAIKGTFLEVMVLCILLIAEISAWTTIGSYRSRQQILNLMIPVLIFIAMKNINFTKKKIFILLLLITLITGYISILGIYQRYYGFEVTGEFLKTFNQAEDRILEDAGKRIGTGRVYSTFTLPSTLAGFLGMSIPIVLFLFITSNYSLMRIFSLIILLSACFTLLLTKSFGGISSFFISSIIFIFLYIASRYKLSAIKLLTVILIFIILSTTIIIFVGHDRPDTPWNFNHPDNPMFLRLKNFKAATGIIKDFPLLGTGPGTFGSIYPKYAPKESNQSQHVHNSYLEFGAETGLVGFVLICFFGIYWFYKAVKYCFMTERENTQKRMIFFVLAGSTFLIHNLVDFDFYSPGLSSYAFAVLALPFITERKYIIGENRVSNDKYISVLGFVLIGLGIYIYSSVMHYEANNLFGVKDRIFWKSRLSEQNMMMTNLKKAVKFESDNPIHYVYMAKLYEHRASLNRGYSKKVDLKEAIKCFEKAIDQEPYVADSYGQAGRLCLMAGESIKAVNFFKMAVRNNPNNDIYKLLLKKSISIARSEEEKFEKLK